MFNGSCLINIQSTTGHTGLAASRLATGQHNLVHRSAIFSVS